MRTRVHKHYSVTAVQRLFVEASAAPSSVFDVKLGRSGIGRLTARKAAGHRGALTLPRGNVPGSCTEDNDG